MSDKNEKIAILYFLFWIGASYSTLAMQQDDLHALEEKSVDVGNKHFLNGNLMLKRQGDFASSDIAKYSPGTYEGLLQLSQTNSELKHKPFVSDELSASF